MTDKKDNPGVIAPPPLIFLGGLLLGGFVAYHHPFQILPIEISRLFGALFFLSGIAVVLIAWMQMRQRKTNIEPWKPTTAIIENGVYKFSRNPIYLAMILICIGIAFAFNSVWFFPFLAISVLVIHFGVILREERYLQTKFGEEYKTYRKRVRRWI